MSLRNTLAATCVLTACTGPTPPQQRADTMPRPLTDTAGTVESGRLIFASRTRGHCVLCHQVSGLDAAFQGNVGPALTGIGSRLSPAQLRQRIANNAAVNPDTVMPPYYMIAGLSRVDPAYQGQTMLPAQDIEDLIAYLASLKDVPA